jgi:2-polyprenyl-3-methyl-5-hydroxy-6-metoxy-1,4-benzoquinol methylase
VAPIANDQAGMNNGIEGTTRAICRFKPNRAKGNRMQNNYEIEKSILGRQCYNIAGPYRKLNLLQDKIKKNIEQKIQDKIYTFEYANCPICVQSTFANLSKFDRYGLRHNVVICTGCGLIMANPRMTQDAYTSFYNLEYRPLYHGETNYAEKAIQNEINRGKLLFKYLNRKGILSKLPKDSLILEIGCGAGGILNVFSAYGFDTMGIDVNEEYLSYGRDKYGLNLHVNCLDTIQLKCPPSLVIYSHVIEHILNIPEEVEKLKRIISDDSLLYIEVPGTRHLHRSNYDFMDSLQNAHVYYFTLVSLCNLLQQNALDLVVGDEYVRSIFRKSKLIRESIVAKNCFRSTIAYLKRIEWQRTFMPTSPYVLARRLRSCLISS